MKLTNHYTLYKKRGYDWFKKNHPELVKLYPRLFRKPKK